MIYYSEPDPWTGQPKRPSFKHSADKLLKSFQHWWKKWDVTQLNRYLKLPGKIPGRPSFTNKQIIFSLLTHLLLGWIALGFFVVKPHRETIITRLGHYDRTVKQGIHWHLRFVEKKFTFNIGQAKRFSHTMTAFTNDGSLVSVSMEVIYHIQNSHQFLFAAKNPIEYFHQAIISSFHHEINQHGFKDLFNLTTRQTIHKNVENAIKILLTRYPLGIELTEITLPTIRNPYEVQKGFESIEKAKKEADHLIQEAQAEVSKIQHTTALKVQQIYEKSQAEKHAMIIQSKADINRFLTLLPAYEEDPQLTTQQLYFRTIESILKKTPKALIVQPGQLAHSNNSSLQVSLEQVLGNLMNPATLNNKNSSTINSHVLPVSTTTTP